MTAPESLRLTEDIGFALAANLTRKTMFDHIWFWRTRLPERKNTECRVLVRGKMNNILVEFAHGFKVVTSRYAVRKKK
jgi:hypothetical protein